MRRVIGCLTGCCVLLGLGVVAAVKLLVLNERLKGSESRLGTIDSQIGMVRYDPIILY